MNGVVVVVHPADRDKLLSTTVVYVSPGDYTEDGTVADVGIFYKTIKRRSLGVRTVQRQITGLGL